MEQFEDTIWFGLILGFGALQGFLVSFTLLKVKQGNIKANRKLSLLILLLSIGLVGRFAYNTRVWETIPQLFLLEDIALFLYGPLFYMYLKDILFRDPRYFRNLWVHFVPTILHFITIGLQFAVSPDVYLKMVAEFYPPLFNAWYLTEILALLQLTIYLILSFRLLLTYNKIERQFLSFDPQSSYLTVLMSIIFVGVGMWWYNYFRFISGIPKLSIWLGFDAAWCTITILNFVLGYYAITNQELFQIAKINAPDSESEKSDIETARLKKVKKLLSDIMEVERPFLNPQLSVFDLASLTQEPPHVVSKTINSSFGQNFFDFVNSYRVEEFIQKAKSDKNKNLTLLAIAFDSGFNSKTAFNKAFKKSKGVTPREYLKNYDSSVPSAVFS